MHKTLTHAEMGVIIKDHIRTLSWIPSDLVDFRHRKLFALPPSPDEVSHASSCPKRCLQYPHITRLLSLLQYELSGYICLCYSGTPNSIPLSCLILHNERLLAAHRIMSDSYDDVCIYFTHTQMKYADHGEQLSIPHVHSITQELNMAQRHMSCLWCVSFRTFWKVFYLKDYYWTQSWV